MKQTCSTCEGTGKLLMGVAHGAPCSDVCPTCNGEGVVCDHSNVREAWNGGFKLINGIPEDDEEFIGLYCADCGKEITQGYLNYINGSDPTDPRD